MKISETVALTGATGFLGRHVLDDMIAQGLTVRALSRNGGRAAGVDWIQGDLLDQRAIDRLVEGAGVVVHLAYSRDNLDANLAMNENLALAGTRAGVSHFIHCSTAVVVGRAGGDVVRESTPCNPRTPYEKNKYAIEQVIYRITAKRIPLSIVRPTAILGKGGKNLLKSVSALRSASPAGLTLRSMVSGRRKLNLVPVEDVVRAISLLVAGPGNGGFAPTEGPRIVSADEDQRNNYRTVARIVAEELGRDAGFAPPFSLPSAALTFLQKLRGGDNAPPRRSYLSEYAEWREKTRVTDLEEAVRRYVRAFADGPLG